MLFSEKTEKKTSQKIWLIQKIVVILQTERKNEFVKIFVIKKECRV